jgi:hypothetical protein
MVLPVRDETVGDVSPEQEVVWSAQMKWTLEALPALTWHRLTEPAAFGEVWGSKALQSRARFRKGHRGTMPVGRLALIRSRQHATWP